MTELTPFQWRALGHLYNRTEPVSTDEIRTLAELPPGVLADLRAAGLARPNASNLWEITGDGRGAIDAELKVAQDEIRAGLGDLVGNMRMAQDQEAQTLGRVVEEAIREFLPDKGFFEDGTACPPSYISVVADAQEPGDEEAGILRMKLKLDPDAPDHVRDLFRRVVEGPTEEELEDYEDLSHLPED